MLEFLPSALPPTPEYGFFQAIGTIRASSVVPPLAEIVMNG
jgi:hypothetical protein